MSESTFDRRAVLKAAGAAAVGISAIAQAAAGRRKYVNVGVGSRSRMYLTAITKTFAKDNELVAICDTNPGRSTSPRKFVAPNGGKPEEIPGRRLRQDAQGDEAGLRHRHLPQASLRFACTGPTPPQPRGRSTAHLRHLWGLPQGPRPRRKRFLQRWDGHDHWHVFKLQEFSIHRINTDGQKARRWAQVPSRLLLPNVVTPTAYRSPTPPKPSGTRVAEHGSVNVKACVSVGWADKYGPGLANQSIKINRLPDGTYRVRVKTDPYNSFARPTTPTTTPPPTSGSRVTPSPRLERGHDSVGC